MDKEISPLVITKCVGLYTSPNTLDDSAPVGNLSIALNITIDDKNIIRSRRGQKSWSTTFSSPVQSITEYKNVLLAAYDNKIARDSGAGTFVNYSGTYNKPTTTNRIRFAQMNDNLYFNTTSGIYKSDNVLNEPRKAGVQKALDFASSLVGSGGFLLHNDQVAYRTVWTTTDENKNLVIGSPSQRLVVSNSTGGTKNVRLVVQIPDSISTLYTLQVYRSPMSGSLSVEPSDELQLVKEVIPTSSEITAKTLTLTDDTPDLLKGAALYTNSNQQGILEANEQPPLAIDICPFKNHMFFANTTTKQTLNTTLISTDTTLGLHYQSNNTTLNGTTIATMASTTGLTAGMAAFGTGIPANTTIVSVDSSTQITLSNVATVSATNSILYQDVITVNGISFFAGGSESVANRQFISYTAGTPGENNEDTALSFTRIFNQVTGVAYAYYVSQYEDTPGQILFEERSIGGSSYVVTSSKPNAFLPALSNKTSTNDNKPNRIYFSKLQQPEAVPVLNFLDIGSQSKPIRRILASRDSLFALKDDGVYRITGDSKSTFQQTLVDNTVKIVAYESAQVLNNEVYFFSDQGFASVTESQGVTYQSEAIKDEVVRLTSDEFTNFNQLTSSVSIETDRKYIVYTVTDPNDTYATQAYVFNYGTSTWTKWDTIRSCGFHNSFVDKKLYSYNPITNTIYQERKLLNRTDYVDDSFVKTITLVSGNNITLNNVTNLQVGYTIVQSLFETNITAINGNIITVEDGNNFTTGSCEVFQYIENIFEYDKISYGNPHVVKNIKMLKLFFADADFNSATIGFSTDLVQNINNTTIVEAVSSQSRWGTFGWGAAPWGGRPKGIQTITTYVPRNYKRCSYVNIRVTTRQAFAKLSFEGLTLSANSTGDRVR